MAGHEAAGVEGDDHEALSGLPARVPAPVRCDLAGSMPVARVLIQCGAGESIALPSWCD
jgi:hypothetical protein